MTTPLKTHLKCPRCGSNDAATMFEKGRYYCHGACGGKYFTTEEYT